MEKQEKIRKRQVKRVKILKSTWSIIRPSQNINVPLASVATAYIAPNSPWVSSNSLRISELKIATKNVCPNPENPVIRRPKARKRRLRSRKVLYSIISSENLIGNLS